MRLQLRFTLLLAVLFTALLAVIWLHDRSKTAGEQRLRAGLQRERELLAERLIELTGEPLRVFVADYAPWDDMVAFVRQPDPNWARINLADALGTHHVDAIWVLRPDFSEVYGVARDQDPELRQPVLGPADWARALGAPREVRFFVITPAGLLEIRAAPVRPSDLQVVTAQPAGWLVAARRWDDAYLRQLETLLDAKVSIAVPGAPVAAGSAIVTAAPLPDWQQRPLRELRTEFHAASLERAHEEARSDLEILAAVGALSLLSFAIATRWWVTRPLVLLRSSLQQRAPAPLQGLLTQRGEFGALARQMVHFYAQEEKLRQIFTAFNAIDDAVFITEAETGVITHANLGAGRLLGYPAEALAGRRLAELTTTGASPGQDGTWLRCRDGRLVEVEMREQVLGADTAKPSKVTVARDLSPRRQQEQLRLRAQRLESLGTLAGGVAHDMNNLLTPITMILDELEHAAAPDRALVASVRSSVKRGATMMRQLLTFGRGVEGENAPVAVGRIVEEIGRIVESTFPKSIAFHARVARQLPAVTGDATQLHQVLLNLAVNARDAMPDGGDLVVRASPVALPAASPDWPEAPAGAYVLIEVEDSGTGIPAEHLDRIFDPFFTTKSPDKGTGLGLSTTLGIVRGHRGYIHVQSESGRGTTFRVLLPAAAETLVAPAERGGPAATCAGGGRTVLVIDDEETIRFMLAKMLQRLGYRALVAADGREGLQLFAHHRREVAAVVTDLQMPHVDGLAVLRAVHADRPEVPVFVMSGRVDETVLAALRQQGVARLIDKPFGYDQIVEAMQSLAA